MDLVDDEDLVAIARRPDAEAGDDHLSHLVDLGIGCGVDLDDVEVAAFGDFDAGIAFAARVGRRAVHAVQPAREDPGGRGLADAARPGKHERLRNPVAGDRVSQRLRDTALPDDVIEPLRAPFSSENLVRQCWMLK